MDEISVEELRKREETIRQLASAAHRQLQKLGFPTHKPASFVGIEWTSHVRWNGSQETGWRVANSVYMLHDSTLVVRKMGSHVDTFSELAADTHNRYYSRGQLKNVAGGLIRLIKLENPDNEDLGGVNRFQLRAILDIPERTFSSTPSEAELHAEQRAQLPLWKRWLS